MCVVVVLLLGESICICASECECECVDALDVGAERSTLLAHSLTCLVSA